LILYIPNATVDQYSLILDRFALIQEIYYIELKLDASSQFCNDNSINGTTSILSLIKQFKNKLPSLKVLRLIFRERDFTLISEEMKRQYNQKIARTSKFSIQLGKEVDIMNDSQIISWIAQREGL
jgi:hypothetical protein